MICLSSNKVSEADVIYLAEQLLRDKFNESTPLDSPTEVKRYLKLKFADLEHEVFAVIHLDNRHKVICLEELLRGTIDGVYVPPREVVKSALRNNAAALILVHNHPSGDPEPSTADRSMTEKLTNALGTVGIKVLDHMVVGKKEVVAFSERGYL